MIVKKIIPAIGPIFAILAALITGGIILLVIGLDPIRAYSELFKLGMGTYLGITESLKRMVPLLIISAGLIIVFKAGIWNIGINGQFLIGAILVGWLAPLLINRTPLYLSFLISGLIGFLGGAIWVIIPAMLKAKYEINEIIATMMMDFVAFNFTSYLVKGPLNAYPGRFPQTTIIHLSKRLPHIPFTDIHIGLVVGLLLIIAAHFFVRRTTWGYEFRLLGENKRTALHAGINVQKVIFVGMLISGGLAGLAGANDVLGIKGAFQAEWNPGYCFAAVPLVFLARFNGIAVIPLAYFFSFLMVGGEFMSRAASVPVYFVHVIEALMLLFFSVIEYIQKKEKLFWKS